ncbi:TrkA C-terminal domain-containing protein [Microvirga splendida]|uniref:TrkA C-terminal domain-containing protein n=1 Tax=Microvirga splendida TaxID=2795727 RepID=A0ABS0Y8A4_9HYPH|nr:TrkA C-terminal domain-containing protein [Microvirga splendida]MBJ6128529.1 TrkA C-terminal domain-containing protein [Microvirga splendida]
MVAVASLIMVLLLSLIVVRIAAEALIPTGMSRQAARFQARSAWTGTGFTTAEAEQVVNHPVRRQIISNLMFLRSAGLVTAASSLMLSFVSVEERGEGLLRLLMLIGGLAGVWFIARSRWIGIWMSRAIARALKRYTDLDTRDYAGLLHLAGEYAVMELKVQEGSWLAGRTLQDLRLPEEGVLVLGLTHPDGRYEGAPRGPTVARTGDILVLYGRSSELAELSRRRAGIAGESERKVAVEIEQHVESELDLLRFDGERFGTYPASLSN